MIKRGKKHIQSDYLFERLNSKYNRLWEQITDIGILCVEIIVVYFVGILAIDTTPPATFEKMVYVTMIIVLILVGLAFSIGRLEFERIETKKGLFTFVDS